MTGDSTVGGLIETLIDYRGKTPPKTSSGVPLITAKVIKGGTILAKPREYIADEAYDGWMRRGLPKTGDILITTEAPLGEVARVGEDERIALAQRVILIRPDAALVDPSFFFHYLRSPQARVSLMRRASGTTVSGIRQPELKAVEIPLIPRSNQERVGGILDAIDDLIENNRRGVDVLEEMALAIYREWFVHFRYPGYETVPLIDSPSDPIPEGWSWASIDSLVDIVKETLDPSSLDPATPAVGLEHIPRRQITLDDWGRAGDLGSRKATFKKGDILFGKIRPYFHKVSVAAVDGICSTDAIVIRPKPVYWGEAVAVIASDEFVAHATQTSNGTKMPRADWKVIGKYPVVVPPTSISSSFTQLIRDHLDLADRLMFDSRRLAEMRDLLLPKLVTGQVDVSTLDLDGLLEGAVA